MSEVGQVENLSHVGPRSLDESLVKTHSPDWSDLPAAVSDGSNTPAIELFVARKSKVPIANANANWNHQMAGLREENSSGVAGMRTGRLVERIFTRYSKAF